MKTKLLSPEGFDYILEQSRRPISKDYLASFLNNIHTNDNFNAINEKGGVKQLKKLAQYQGILKLIKSLGITGPVIEIGCGNGVLTHLMSLNGTEITGLDYNGSLINKVSKKNNRANVQFKRHDARNPYKGIVELVVGLHCCGNLSDSVIDRALDQDAAVICIPCCYGKINKDSKVLPRSSTLARRKKEFEYVLERTRSLEGYVETGKKCRANLLLDLYRTLVNFDRAFYLIEQGYDVRFSRITGDKVQGSERKHRASPVRSAIVGKNKGLYHSTSLIARSSASSGV